MEIKRNITENAENTKANCWFGLCAEIGTFTHQNKVHFKYVRVFFRNTSLPVHISCSGSLSLRFTKNLCLSVCYFVRFAVCYRICAQFSCGDRHCFFFWYEVPSEWMYQFSFNKSSSYYLHRVRTLASKYPILNGYIHMQLHIHSNFNGGFCLQKTCLHNKIRHQQTRYVATKYITWKHVWIWVYVCFWHPEKQPKNKQTTTTTTRK